MPPALEIVVVVLLVLVNGMFSMAEMAMVTARKPRLSAMAEAGDKRARIALELLATPERLLSTVQVGITLVSVLTSALAGITFSDRLAGFLVALGAPKAPAQVVSVVLVVLLITYLTLVIGELAPKRIALKHSESLALAMARPMQWLAAVARPVVTLLSATTSGVIRMLGFGGAPDADLTEEDVKMLIREGGRVGVLHKIEHEILERVVSLDELEARDLMTTRVEIDWLDSTASWEQNRSRILETNHSKYPVCEGSLDAVTGIVGIPSIWRAESQDQAPDLRALASPPLFVPINVTALRLLEQLKDSHAGAALVLDEHGSIDGLVTLNDLLEAVVGDIRSISEGESLVVEREDGSLLVDGLLPVSDFSDAIGFDLDKEDRGDYTTLAGFVMHSLGRVPKPGDFIEQDGFRFEVMDLDGRRIDKVLVSPARNQG